VQTLNFVPYRVDLTPFAGVLSNGQPHTVAVSVFNADNYFTATATLLLFLDRESEQVTGEVTQNTIGSNPSPVVNENLQTDSSGNVSGTVTVSSSRAFTVAGFVNTSRGRVDTTVQQNVNFNNAQNFTINATAFVQDVKQNTTVNSSTTTRRGPVGFSTSESFQYPLTLNIAFLVASDGSASQLTTASQEFKVDLREPFFASSVSNKVDSTDTLNFSASGAFTGDTGQKSSQNYSFANSRGQAYNCALQAENRVLTSASEGCTEQIRFK
jgi:Peptide N-acetyl-beta-D-glucosaminyl asparaginase amidase A